MVHPLPTAVLGLVAAAAAASVGAAPPPIDGAYESPLGRIRVSGDGKTYRGVLVAPAARCPLQAGEEVLRATLLDDSLAGELRVCLTGPGCAAEEWSSVVLVVGRSGLSGAVHVAAKGCAAPVGGNGGVVLTRSSQLHVTRSSSPSIPSPSPPRSGGEGRGAREEARMLLRDGAAYLREGAFEKARRRFLAALDVDPTVPEAYNGVGVTYRMRNDLPRALEWYKRALAVDPDFGDAYYNMACVYALEGRKRLALRYLQIAALNGYATAEGMDRDPDLEPVRGEPAYRALVRARM